MMLAKIGLAIIVVGTLCACGVTATGLKNDPGYASMTYPRWWDADRELSLSLGPGLLGSVSWATDEGNPLFSDALQQLKGLRIRIYKATDEVELLHQCVTKSGIELEKKGWNRVVSVNEAESRVLIMIKPGVDVIDGVVVMTSDEKEAVFINLIGNLGPEFFNYVIEQVHSGDLRISL